MKPGNTYALPPFSLSWYAIGEMKELDGSGIVRRTFAGQEVVIFKGKSGAVAVVDAYCPHMGAHLGYGEVKDDTIVCPFHGFCFNGRGECTATGYDTPPPAGASIYSWPVKLIGGVIFCWYHPNRQAPDWEPEAFAEQGWTDFKIHTWQLESNVVEIAENSVDVGHFSYVHKYDKPYIIDPLTTQGHILRAAYGMGRKGKSGTFKQVDAQFRIFQQGLGLAVVTTSVQPFGLRTRHLVMATPIDGTRIYLRIGAAVDTSYQKKKLHPLAVLAPKGMLTRIIHQQTFKGYIHDVHQDFVIWEHKKYVHPPVLAKGDGPVLLYRKWAAQFDPATISQPKPEPQPAAVN